MALRSSSLTPKPRWPAEEGWLAAAGLPEGFQDAPRFLDANIFEAGFRSLANCAAVGEGQAAAIPGAAAHVDGPPEAIAADAVHAAQLASIEDATAEAFQSIFNIHKGRGPGRPRGGSRRQGGHASKGPPAPLSHIARGHVGVAKKRLLAVERHTASLRLGYAKLATAWNAAHGLRGGERVDPTLGMTAKRGEQFGRCKLVHNFLVAGSLANGPRTASSSSPWLEWARVCATRRASADQPRISQLSRVLPRCCKNCKLPS